MSSASVRLPLLALLLATLVIRSSVLWTMRANLEQDADMYREIADNLLRHGEFALGKDENGPVSPTAYRPPLYPVVLSNLAAADQHHLSLTKVAILHVLLGVATASLTWLTARHLCRVRETHQPATPGSQETVRFTHPTMAPLLAGCLVACDPILLNQQTLIMTETLAAFLAILSLWCLARFDSHRSWFNAALTGGAIGLAILCRPTFLPWLGLVAMVMLLVSGRNSEFRIENSELGRPQHIRFAGVGWRVSNAVALCIAAAAVLSPWAIRNYQVFGKPIITTTHGGYTLYLGNNVWFYDYIRQDGTGLPWSLPFADNTVRELVWGWMGPVNAHPRYAREELSIDRAYYWRARTDISSNPSLFVRACLYRLRQLWSPLPYKLTVDESLAKRLLRYGTAAWYCGVYALAAVGVWRLRWKLLQPPWVWGVLLILAFMAVHTFYWTNLRMRAPLMPFVAIVAAAAVSSRLKAAPAILTRSVSEGDTWAV